MKHCVMVDSYGECTPTYLGTSIDTIKENLKNKVWYYYFEDNDDSELIKSLTSFLSKNHDSVDDVINDYNINHCNDNKMCLCD